MAQRSVVIDPMKYLQKLPEFNGDPKELQTFIDLVDRVHPFLQTFDEASQLLFSDLIKSRLRGRAREAIEINCEAIAWIDIKNVLTNNFGDRKTCEQLYDELRAVTFKTHSADFYNEIKSKLRRLNNKILSILGLGDDISEVVANNKRSALNIFKSKIPEPMKIVLTCRNPSTLEDAMDIFFSSGYAYIDVSRQIQNRRSRPKNDIDDARQNNQQKQYQNRNDSQNNHNENPSFKQDRNNSYQPNKQNRQYHNDEQNQHQNISHNHYYPRNQNPRHHNANFGPFNNDFNRLANNIGFQPSPLNLWT
ncbi:unnamed protein product [Hermetia illucens]|uniref:Uncharacterized protein n=1 Tax=Hermetia illucens TaxID=343691 RepID=A0A7R8UD87_HERIL|nr:unnamed protein product [Hermetia illucens]